MTIHFTWWTIPTIITALGLYWPFWMSRKDDGLFAGISLLFYAAPALAVISITWGLAAVFK
jgi:hypothetical protein